MIGEVAFHIGVGSLSQLEILLELKLFHTRLVMKVTADVLPFHSLEYFPYRNMVTVRVKEIKHLLVIIRVDVVLYMLGLPSRSQSFTALSYIQS